MNARAFRTLEFYKIKEELATFTLSGLGKKLVERMNPMIEAAAIAHAQQETTEARQIIDRGGHPPLSGLADIAELVERVAQGAVLAPSDLLAIADLLRGAKRMRRYMEDKADEAPMLSAYAYSLTDMLEIEESILICIEGTIVSSSASQALKSIRQRMRIIETRIQERLNSIISSSAYKEYLQDSFVSVKDGRYVIPIKASFKHKLDGMVIGTSGTGSTVFIEPSAVRKLVNELQALKGEEEAESYQVLAMLSGMIAENLQAFKLNIDTMAALDFVFAKGKYSRSLDAVEPKINTRRRITLKGARHPLLGKQAVPLEFEIGGAYRTLLITGPNTGGKTVTLKTIGLLTIMAQSGLHIPANEGSEVAIYNEVLADIGDGQSIEQSLSTFSSHMKNIAEIVEQANSSTLVLLDEIGTGTDPQEGAALGAAVLDELYTLGATTVATTHYGDLKRFSDSHTGFVNGMMDFDPETLRPLYRLIIGKAGSSNGIWIAERLGLKQSVLEKAREFVKPQGTTITTQWENTQGEPERAEPEQQEAVKPKKVVKDFTIGDRVFVHTVKQAGVVKELPDPKGMMTVVCRRHDVRVNHKRVTLLIEKEELYPDHETYDLNIVLISKEDRKKVNQMKKKYSPGVVRTISKGE